MAKEAAARGVLVSAGRHWYPAEAPGPHLRLAEAVESLAQVIADVAPT